MRILLIRHAESEGNAAQRIQGWNDEPLTDRGREQAKALAKRLQNGYGICAVYASSLSRARQTAEIIAGSLGLTPVLDDRLREYDCGVVTGLTWEEVQAQYPDIARRWAEDSWRVPIPGEEGIELFQQRVVSAMDDVIARHKEEDAVAVVAHGGTWSAYLAYLVGLDYRQRQPWVFDNASLSIIILGGIRPRIALLNDTCHLNADGEK
ncbi:MAG: histidine phosphatase family protein [Chloroflexi bacterium]|nr:histidine phosphatase family protein [Chloroflexota bacterium]